MATYRVRERASFEVRAALEAHSELLQDLLYARGIAKSDDALRFLQPEFERDSHDPFLLPDMGKAVERILAAVKKNEQVCVWSDYDCDGIPGGVLLAEFLRGIGLSVRHYIPHRHNEGYGLNNPGLDEIAEQGVTLVITVDLGITDREAVAFANEKGIDVIITDHHLVPTEAKSISPAANRQGNASEKDFFPDDASAKDSSQNLPLALAVINPKRLDSNYPFDALCGAGVAWKLVQAILARDRFGMAEGQEKWLLDLVGIATLSDMVPLVGENRMLARYGLVVLRKNRRPGFSALLSMLRIQPHSLTEDDIGFMISPRINAASRMDSPDLAARLLATDDAMEAAELARALNKINEERKTLVATTVKEVNKRMLSAGMQESPIIVMGNPNWRPGILGLVANSLAQTHNKSVFLWGREGGETLRGSCRSDGSTNMVELMSGAGDVFEDFGGHFAAGGFSLTEEKATELKSGLLHSYELLRARTGEQREVIVDREMELTEIPHALRELVQLAPFGIDNPKPLFIFRGVYVSRVRMFGKGAAHLEVGLSKDGSRIVGIAFFSTVHSFQKQIIEGSNIDVVGHIETDWRGQARLRIVDIL